MKAYICLYIGLFYPNVVLSLSTSLGHFVLDSGRPAVISMNGGNIIGANEIVLQAQGKTNDDEAESNVIKPTWVKKTDRLHDSNKPWISNNLGINKDTEIKGTNHGQSERSDDDQGDVRNIGEQRQPGSIFFNPYWTSQAKNPLLYHENNGFIYQPDKNGFHDQPGNNAFINYPGQNGIYAASKGNIVQIGKGNSQVWKPQHVGNKGSDKHPGHTPISGSKAFKQSHNFQIGKSFYSLSKSNPVFEKKYPLRNRIIYSKRDGPIKKHQGNQEITNRLPNILRSPMNSSSFEEGNGNDAEKPSEAKIRVHPYRHKRSKNENDNELTPTGQFWVWNTNSPNGGNLIPVHHSLNHFDPGDFELTADQPLEINTLKTGTNTDKRIRAPKGHSWNQRDLQYSGNLIHPARHSLNPIILGAKGLNMLHTETLNTDHPGGRNTNHPDEQSNGNSATQNLDVERNIHYPDITGMKNVHPKDLLHYLRRVRVLVEPSKSTLPAGVQEVPNAKKITPPDSSPASKWGGILFRSLPKNGTRSRFMSFPLGPSNILRDDDGPVKYKFHFGGILWWR